MLLRPRLLQRPTAWAAPTDDRRGSVPTLGLDYVHLPSCQPPRLTLHKRNPRRKSRRLVRCRNADLLTARNSVRLSTNPSSPVVRPSDRGVASAQAFHGAPCRGAWRDLPRRRVGPRWRRWSPWGTCASRAGRPLVWTGLAGLAVVVGGLVRPCRAAGAHVAGGACVCPSGGWWRDPGIRCGIRGCCCAPPTSRARPTRPLSCGPKARFPSGRASYRARRPRPRPPASVSVSRDQSWPAQRGPSCQPCQVDEHPSGCPSVGLFASDDPVWLGPSSVIRLRRFTFFEYANRPMGASGHVPRARSLAVPAMADPGPLWARRLLSLPG